MISEQDLTMIKYFWEEKGDIERWVSWKERLPLIEKEAPEIVKAWIDFKMAERILTAVINGVESDE